MILPCSSWCSCRRNPSGRRSPRRRATAPLDKSAYFAFVDREYIFTIEMVKPGVPLFNFISMTDAEQLLPAKEVRLTLDSRKALGKFFMVDTGRPKGARDHPFCPAAPEVLVRGQAPG